MKMFIDGVPVLALQNFNWKMFSAITIIHSIEPEKHCIVKLETTAIERNNGRQRHWLGRFRRRSVIVSKSLEMVNLCIALFAYY